MTRRYRIEVKPSSTRGWFWHLVSANNGQVLATSEKYVQQSSALKTAQGLRATLGCHLTVYNRQGGVVRAEFTVADR